MKRAEKYNAEAEKYSELFRQTRSFHHYEMAKMWRTKALKAELRAK